MLLDVDFVVAVHDEIIATIGGLPGMRDGIGAVEAALARVEHHAYYAGLNDALGIAALYAEAIACGHPFNDGNKRTALTCAITYLDRQGIQVRQDPILVEVTVMLAKGTWSREDFAWTLALLAGLGGYLPPEPAP